MIFYLLGFGILFVSYSLFEIAVYCDNKYKNLQEFIDNDPI